MFVIDFVAKAKAPVTTSCKCEYNTNWHQLTCAELLRNIHPENSPVTSKFVRIRRK